MIVPSDYIDRVHHVYPPCVSGFGLEIISKNASKSLIIGVKAVCLLSEEHECLMNQGFLVSQEYDLSTLLKTLMDRVIQQS